MCQFLLKFNYICKQASVAEIVQFIFDIDYANLNNLGCLLFTHSVNKANFLFYQDKNKNELMISTNEVITSE
jgi:hypothetical protein